MTDRDERHDDIVENCDILLARLKDATQTDSTPEGRMISQLKWLRERAQAGTLPLPVDLDYIATLRHIYTEGNLFRLAKDHATYLQEFEIPMERLLVLTRRGKRLLKENYYSYAVKCLDKLIDVLQHAPRQLSAEEQATISELEKLREDLVNAGIEPPLMNWKKQPNFRRVYSMVGSTIDDIPGAKAACREVVDLVFNGVRPDSWTSPEAADIETSFSSLE